MKDPSCDNEACREPHGKSEYVVRRGSGEVQCLYCFLVFDRGMDPAEAHDIQFQGGENQ